MVHFGVLLLKITISSLHSTLTLGAVHGLSHIPRITISNFEFLFPLLQPLIPYPSPTAHPTPHLSPSIPTNCLANSTNVSSFPLNLNPSTLSANSLLHVYAFSGSELVPGLPMGVFSASSGICFRSMSAISCAEICPAQIMKRELLALGTVAARICAWARSLGCRLE